MTSIPKFSIRAALGQVFHLPGGMGYVFRVAGAATLLWLIAYAIFGPSLVKSYVSFFLNMAALESAMEPTSQDIAGIMSGMGAFFGVLILFYVMQIGIIVAVETAIYRNILRGEDKGLFPLRFGKDEWRVLGLRLVVGLLLYLILMAIYIMFAALIIVFSFVIPIGVEGGGALASIMGIITFLLGVAAFIGLALISVRFAPSSAFNVRDKDFNPVKSWGPMKPYMWKALAAVLAAGVSGYVGLWILCIVVIFAFLFTSGLMSRAAGWEGLEPMAFLADISELASSPNFVISLFFALGLMSFFGCLYMSWIWSIWGYCANLARPAQTDLPAQTSLPTQTSLGEPAALDTPS